MVFSECFPLTKQSRTCSCCVVLWCVVLWCVTLCYVVLRCVALCCVVFYCVVLSCVVLWNGVVWSGVVCCVCVLRIYVLCVHTYEYTCRHKYEKMFATTFHHFERHLVPPPSLMAPNPDRVARYNVECLKTRTICHVMMLFRFKTATKMQIVTWGRSTLRCTLL